MPNIKASKKAVKTITKKTDNNHELKEATKNYIRKCDYAIHAGDKEKAVTLFKEVQKSIDSAVSKGLIKKNTADRQKSRLDQKIKAMK